MTTVFADTWYYLALLNGDDESHASVTAWTQGFAGRIVTTDWVLTELADGFSRGVARTIVAQFVQGCWPGLTFASSRPSDNFSSGGWSFSRSAPTRIGR